MSEGINISDLITAAACASPLEKYKNMSNQEVIDFLLKRVEEAEKNLANTKKGGGGE